MVPDDARTGCPAGRSVLQGRGLTRVQLPDAQPSNHLRLHFQRDDAITNARDFTGLLPATEYEEDPPRRGPSATAPAWIRGPWDAVGGTAVLEPSATRSQAWRQSPRYVAPPQPVARPPPLRARLPPTTIIHLCPFEVPTTGLDPPQGGQTLLS